MYGSTEVVANNLRSRQDGLLRTEKCDNGLECLPFAENITCLGKSARCALAGKNGQVLCVNDLLCT